MKVEKKEHSGYTDQMRIPQATHGPSSLPSVFGQYQYIYSGIARKGKIHVRGKISLVELPMYADMGGPWEIYSLKGDLFEDVERFPTKPEAENRIKELIE